MVPSVKKNGYASKAMLYGTFIWFHLVLKGLAQMRASLSPSVIFVKERESMWYLDHPNPSIKSDMDKLANFEI